MVLVPSPSEVLAKIRNILSVTYSFSRALRDNYSSTAVKVFSREKFVKLLFSF